MMYRLSSKLAAIAQASEEILAQTIAERMRRLAIPEEIIGFSYNRQSFAAFTRNSLSGGSNLTVFFGHKPGICVDSAVLDPRFPIAQGNRIEAWEIASLWDRIDAVIAHEYTEALVERVPRNWNSTVFGVWDPHKHALVFAPQTAKNWALSARAISILEETKRVAFELEI